MMVVTVTSGATAVVEDKWQDKRPSVLSLRRAAGDVGGGTVLRTAGVWVGEGGVAPSLARTWLSDGFLSC